MTENNSTISDRERFDRLQLIRSENVGPVTFRQLITKFGSADEALRALPDLAARGGMKRKIKIASKDGISREFDAAETVGAQWISIGEPEYPAALGTLNDSPPMLCIKGHPVIFQNPAIGIVGSRTATAQARKHARILARDLGAAGIAVCSGMARGLDAAAHEGSLKKGTIAVLGGGVDVIFPPENEELYHQICESGVVVSEMPVGTVPKARHFPPRNRIISGISYGVVVIEAALRSGSLITARYAADQGREVFAVPGSPLDPRCKGTNNLIRNGAQLTETAEDILQVLQPMLSKPLAEPESYTYRAAGPTEYPDLDAALATINELLGPTPVEIDELIRQSKLTPAAVLTILLELELAGGIERHAGQKVSQSL